MEQAASQQLPYGPVLESEQGREDEAVTDTEGGEIQGGGGGGEMEP